MTRPLRPSRSPGNRRRSCRSSGVVGWNSSGPVEEAEQGRRIVEQARSAPSPHACTRIRPASAVTRSVAGPSGVRVARQTSPRAIRIVGSPEPRRWGARTWVMLTGVREG